MSAKEVFFQFPQAGMLLLLLFPLLYGQWALQRYRKRQQHSYASPSLLPHLLLPRSSQLTYTKLAGWVLIWTLACLALMQPLGNLRYSPLPSPAKPLAAPHEVIFLVDTSASMRVPDGPEGEVRLEEAKTIMEDILRQLQGQTFSLYTFTSELSAVVPPTVDLLFMRLSIKELQVNQGDVGGTRLAPVLKALKQQVFPQPSPKRYTVVLLSDGGDTLLETLTRTAQEQEREAILTAISDPQQLHVSLFTIGVGSLQPQAIPHVTFNSQPVLSKLEPEILQQLAVKERGKYYRAQEWSSWNLAHDIVSQIESEGVAEQPERQVTAINQEDILVDLYFQIPLGLALLFYILNLLLPDTKRA